MKPHLISDVDSQIVAAGDAYRSGNYDVALGYLKRAFCTSPEAASISEMAGVSATQLGDPPSARFFFKFALRLDPKSVSCRLNLVSFLLRELSYGDALAGAEQVIAIQPGQYPAYNNRAIALTALDQLPASLVTYQRAVKLDPQGNPRAQTNLGQLLLASRQYESGWKYYATRFLSGTTPLKSALPDYLPEQGCRQLLLWGDQGLGDQIMFGSLIGDFRRSSQCFVLQIDDRLIGLFKRAFPSVQVQGERAAAGDSTCDARLALGDLGGLLRDSARCFDHQPTGYLKADPKLSTTWAERLQGLSSLPRVGISWYSANRDSSLQRSLAWDQLANLLAVPEVVFLNLQYGSREDDLIKCRDKLGRDYRCVDFPYIDKTNDIENLAAMIEACDLVLTIGNTTAHLAAALGKPTWVLLPKPAGWRWMNAGSRTPWYPSARLYRQHLVGDWSGVLADVQNDLRRWVAAREHSTPATQPNV